MKVRIRYRCRSQIHVVHVTHLLYVSVNMESVSVHLTHVAIGSCQNTLFSLRIHQAIVFANENGAPQCC